MSTAAQARPTERTPTAAVRRLVTIAAERHSCPVDAVFSKRRHQAASFARQYAWWLMKHDPETQGLSLSEIGSYFGGRDHTTVLHGVRAHGKRCGLTPLLIQVEPFSESQGPELAPMTIDRAEKELNGLQLRGVKANVLKGVFAKLREMEKAGFR